MPLKTDVVRPTPVLTSAEGPTTRQCRLRFVNNWHYPIDVLWLDHEGAEKKYATVQPGGQSPQGTYTTHAWRVRETGSERLLGTYVGEEATLELTPAAGMLVHKGFRSADAFGRKRNPPAWGKFQQRGEAHGIPIRAFQCVDQKAIARAEHVLTRMLEHTPKAMLERLHENSADVAIIGRDQVTSDMPMHSFLKGQDSDYGHRTCDNGMRGVGGSWTVSTASAAEENLLMEDGRQSPSEDILIHEMAHSVMSIAMNEDQRQAVMSAYFNARATLLYRPTCYMVSSADEYWAEGAQIWFEATARTDVNDGINTRQKLRWHDPQLAALLEHAFGDGEWRYGHTAPTNFLIPGKRQGSQTQAGRQRYPHIARYSLCCWTSWTSLWGLPGEKSYEKVP